MTHAEIIAEYMDERGFEYATWGDAWLTSAIASHTKFRHPLDIIQAACNAMARSDLFETKYIDLEDSRGRAREVRCFRLLTPNTKKRPPA